MHQTYQIFLGDACGYGQSVTLLASLYVWRQCRTPLAPSILRRWGITDHELTALVDANPSLRGILIGYVAELQMTKLLAATPHVTDLGKADDHDRTNN